MRVLKLYNTKLTIPESPLQLWWLEFKSVFTGHMTTCKVSKFKRALSQPYPEVARMGVNAFFSNHPLFVMTSMIDPKLLDELEVFLEGKHLNSMRWSGQTSITIAVNHEMYFEIEELNLYLSQIFRVFRRDTNIEFSVIYDHFDILDIKDLPVICVSWKEVTEEQDRDISKTLANTLQIANQLGK